MKLFTPGPVNLPPELLKITGNQEEYFRNLEFSAVILGMVTKFKEVLNLPEGYEIFFIAGSGTTAMECASHFIPYNEKVLSIETGLFGERFTKILGNQMRNLKRMQIDVVNHQLMPAFEQIADSTDHVHFTLTDTSTGFLLGLSEVEIDARTRSGLVLVDAVTALFTEVIDFGRFDVLYSSSQKGIGCSPGVGFVICSPKAIEKLKSFQPRTLYLDPRIYLQEIVRGQTPFTPPINILHQMSWQINKIDSHSGYLAVVKSVRDRAVLFRSFIEQKNGQTLTRNQANCVTTFRFGSGLSASKLLKTLAENGLYIAPNSPQCFPEFVRVGHFGHQTQQDYNDLLEAITKILESL